MDPLVDYMRLESSAFARREHFYILLHVDLEDKMQSTCCPTTYNDIFRLLFSRARACAQGYRSLFESSSSPELAFFRL